MYNTHTSKLFELNFMDAHQERFQLNQQEALDWKLDSTFKEFALLCFDFSAG